MPVARLTGPTLSVVGLEVEVSAKLAAHTLSIEIWFVPGQLVAVITPTTVPATPLLFVPLIDSEQAPWLAEPPFGQLGQFGLKMTPPIAAARTISSWIMASRSG